MIVICMIYRFFSDMRDLSMFSRVGPSLTNTISIMSGVVCVFTVDN